MKPRHVLAVLCLVCSSVGAQEEKLPIADLIALVKKGTADSFLAAEALSKLGAEASEAAPALKDACAAADTRLRIASAIALTRIDKDNAESVKLAVKTLIEALTDKDEDVRREALRAISRLPAGTPADVKAIANALVDNDDYVAMHAADALVTLGARSVPVLIEATKNEKSILWALLALGDIGVDAKPAQEAVAAALKSEDPIIRQEAAMTMGRIGPDAKSAVDRLLPLLDDSLPAVRAAAARSIIQMGSEASRASDKFRSMHTGSDELSRIIGALALVKLYGRKMEPINRIVLTLSSGLANEHPLVRRECALGLIPLGTSAASARPALEKLRSDEDESIRAAADQALAAIK